MKTHFLAIPCALALVSIAPTVRATGPAGVWGNVSQVVYEPDAKNPTRVRIHGCFLFATDTPGSCQGGTGSYNYSCPETGYMYYECPTGDEDLCKLQWSEIESKIGSGCVGWGQYDQPKGTVRPSSQKPASPDPYPLGMGVDMAGGTPCLVLNDKCSGAAGAAGASGAAGAAGATGSGGSGTGGSGTGGSGTGGAGAASSGGAGATTGSGGTTNGGSAGSGSKPDASSDDDGGCTVRALGSDSTRSALTLGVLALFAALGMRRRRQRR